MLWQGMCDGSPHYIAKIWWHFKLQCALQKMSWENNPACCRAQIYIFRFFKLVPLDTCTFSVAVEWAHLTKNPKQHMSSVSWFLSLCKLKLEICKKLASNLLWFGRQGTLCLLTTAVSYTRHMQWLQSNDAPKITSLLKFQLGKKGEGMITIN